MNPDYQVELDIFRGPLDLLLYLVKRNEVDVCDIPIAPIAEQFVRHLEVLQMIDVDRVGDFLVMASTLMEIKSKMLLPRSDEELSEEDDPRRELVRQLLEYKKFKEAAAMLEERAEQQSNRLARHVEEPITLDIAQQPIRHVELWDLVSAFGRLMRETLALQPKQIVYDETPIHIYMDQIVGRLAEQPRIALTDLFEPPRTRGRLVGLFLALLELIRSKRIAVEQEAPFEDIYLVALPAATL